MGMVRFGQMFDVSDWDWSNVVQEQSELDNLFVGVSSFGHLFEGVGEIGQGYLWEWSVLGKCSMFANGIGHIFCRSSQNWTTFLWE